MSDFLSCLPVGRCLISLGSLHPEYIKALKEAE